MITKLICWLFGCKTVTISEKMTKAPGLFSYGAKEIIATKAPFCVRCGKDLK